MATAPITLDDNTATFLSRALPHFMAGKSVEESLRAVLDDDARLTNASFRRSHSVFFPTPDERGSAHPTAHQTGDLIFSELSRRVYQAFRGGAA